MILFGLWETVVSIIEEIHRRNGTQTFLWYAFLISSFHRY